MLLEVESASRNGYFISLVGHGKSRTLIGAIFSSMKNKCWTSATITTKAKKGLFYFKGGLILLKVV